MWCDSSCLGQVYTYVYSTGHMCRTQMISSAFESKLPDGSLMLWPPTRMHSSQRTVRIDQRVVAQHT